MRLTPLDIRKQEFKKAMRGLDSDEVYAFLSTVADEYEAVLNDNKALRERLLELDDKVQEYRNMEKTLRDTLLTAERITVDAKENARREAELIIKQAELDADRGARDIKENASKLRQEIQLLKRQRESYVTRMKMIVESHLKFLESAEKDFVDEERRMEADDKERLRKTERGDELKTSTRPGENKELKRAAASMPADRDVGESSMSPPLDTPASPLDRPLPDGPHSDSRAKAQGGPDVVTATIADPTPSRHLDNLIERVMERKHELEVDTNKRESAPPKKQAASPVSQPSVTPIDRDVSPVLPKDAEAKDVAEEPGEWSLERLKRDILSRRSQK
ncbi:MAG: DivIVA domain-containing protein [Candidatus Krumholzibacteria bacterium]|nr:DivIVA domain-containing protein [Candidatus Krumholzibacteria bacterium]